MKLSARFKTSDIVLLSIITLLYVVVGKLGLTLASINPSASPVWVPTGIALAVVLIFGYKVLPAIFVGAFFVNVTTAGSVGTSIAIGLGNMLEAYVGGYLVIKYANGALAFDKASDIIKFTLLATILSTMVSATIGVITLILGGYEVWDNFLPVWFTWWLGDAGGNFVVAPLILTWATGGPIVWTSKRFLEFVVWFLALFMAGFLVFTGGFPYPYLTIPFVVWIALRLSQRETALAVCVLCAIAAVNTLLERGPFIERAVDLNQSLLYLQLFAGTLSLTAMTLSAAQAELKKAQKILETNESRFRRLIEKSFDAVVLIDATSKILYASPSVKSLLGYDPEELEGITGLDLVIPEDRNKTVQILTELTRKPDNVVTTEYRSMRKDKRVIWVEATGTNLLFEPNVQAVVVNFRDITERKLASEKIAREKAEDEALLTSIGEGVVATDEKGLIRFMNQKAEDLLGWDIQDLVGKSFLEHIEVEDEFGKPILSENRPTHLALTTGKVSSTRGYMIRRDKTRIPIAKTVTPIKLMGEIIGAVEVFRDMAKEKEIEDMKSEFLSMAAHQLRTPLGTMRWTMELLLSGRSGEMSDQAKVKLGLLYDGNQRLISLVNDLLNVSRIEQGRFPDNPVPTDVVSSVEQVIVQMMPEAKKRNIEIKLSASKEDIPRVVVDPQRFEEVIRNLISNAVKYNNVNGRISILIHAFNNHVSLQVDDTGIGVPQDDLKRIFEKFYRAENAVLASKEGTGLGLYVVQSLVKSWGGTMYLTSIEGKGTTVSITLPAQSDES